MKKLLILLFGILAVSCSVENPVITVSGGKLKGVQLSPDVIVYRGIPYAAAPVGELRWKAPHPAEPWKGVLTADTFGPIAHQSEQLPDSFYGKEFFFGGYPAMSEDCLYLNVWAPAKTVGKPEAGLPVAMWIHGGAFTGGYGHEPEMDGEAWAEHGVILVTVNYRLGVLGFLSHPELSEEQGGVSGNYGQLDQAYALRWIHDNISAFGGSPDRITIFGQSAGAMSVKNLMASPLSRDMIAGAIIQSGGGISAAMQTEDHPQSFYDAQGKAIMDAAGLKDLAAMRAAAPETLIGAPLQYAVSGGSFVMLGPHVDGHFLTETFAEALFDGSIADVPVMTGYTGDDLGILAGAPVDRMCEIRDSLSDKPVFEYEFLRNLPGDDDDPGTDPGAFHSSELWYVFGTLGKSWRPFTENDRELSDEMLGAWISFVKNGDPGWPAYKKASPYKKKFDIN